MAKFLEIDGLSNNHTVFGPIEELLKPDVRMGNGESNNRESSVTDFERVRQLRKRLKEMEKYLDVLVKNEEYEKAAEVDEIVEMMKTHIAETGLTNKQLESIYADELDERNSEWF